MRSGSRLRGSWRVRDTDDHPIAGVTGRVL
jgi:hypothetical protein